MSAKYYITSAIAYANAQPHLGHALEAIQADVVARFRRQHGDDTFFLTGMDEHGLKVQQTAAEYQKTPQQLADEVAVYFENLFKQLNISYSRFIRTSEPDHKAAAAKLWDATKHDIYKAKYTGLYCVGCERYYKKDELENGLCPNHKVAPQEITEENYFFKLSSYTQKIKDLIQKDELKIYPGTRKNEILGLLELGLEDVSISRIKEHLQWGIPVPGDENQVMYVWYDALANYITGVGYATDDKKFQQYWPADMHVIGKDILRFHAALWPAMLMSAGIALPKAIFVHGFITSEGQKMSKSLGNVINPGEVINKYGPDALRYYLMREIATGQDGDFSWERFKVVYESDLANDLGNLVQRVAVMVKRYQGGAIGEVPPHSHDTTRYFEAMEELRFNKALEAVWEEIRGLNQYIEAEKPWELIKSDPEQLADVLAHAVSDLTQIAIMIMPFMPSTAEKITKILSASGTVDMTVGILFPKLEQQVVASDAQQPPTASQT